MPWARVSDDLYDHPKVDALPPRIRLSCIGLHILAITWSNRHLTDGVVPDDRIRKFGGKPAHRDALINAGIWDPLIHAIEVHDFLDYNPSRAQVMAERAAARDRMAKARSRNVHPNKSETNGLSSGEQEANSLPMFGRSSGDVRLTRPDPSRPYPTRPDPAAAAVRKPRDAREVDES